MNEKNQKVLRGIVIAILAIVFAAFVVMYLSGQIGEFSGFTGEVSSPESSVLSEIHAAASQDEEFSVPASVPENSAETSSLDVTGGVSSAESSV